MIALRNGVQALMTLLLMLGIFLSTAEVITAESLTTFTAEDCGCSALGMDTGEAEADKRNGYSILDCHCGPPADGKQNWVEFTIMHLPTPEAALDDYFLNTKKVYAEAAGWAREGRTEGVEPGQLITEADEADRYGYVVFYPNAKPLPFYWGQMVMLRHSNYVGYVHLSGPQMDSAQAMSLFQTAARHVAEIIDEKAGITKDTTLTFRHYPLITTGKEAAPYVGADLVAFLKNNKGKGVGGKEVFFFKKDPGLLDPAFNESLKFPETEELFIDTSAVRELGRLAPDYASDSTDSVWSDPIGEAKFNYYSAIDFGALLGGLKKSGKVSGTIYIVVFDKSPREPDPKGWAKIEHLAKVQLDLNGTAAITSRGAVDSSKKSVLKVMGRDGEQIVGQKPPYYLIEDTIYVDNNTLFTVTWINGTVMTVKVKEGFLKDGEFASFTINYKNAGGYQWFDQTFGSWYVEGTVSIAPTAIGMYVAGTTGAFIGGPISLAVGLVILGYEGAQAYWDPLIVEPHSQILIDMDEGYNVYTLEGSARLRHPDGDSAVDVPEGYATTVSPGGEFGDVSEFDEGDFNNDLNSLAEGMPIEGESEGEPDLGSPTEDDEGLGPIIYIVPAAIGGIVLFAVAVLLLKRRRAPRTAPATMAPASPTPPIAAREVPFVKAEVSSCPKCGAQGRPGAKFCPKCGSALPVRAEPSPTTTAQQVFCPKCGAPNTTGSSFCGKCGSRLGT